MLNVLLIAKLYLPGKKGVNAIHIHCNSVSAFHIKENLQYININVRSCVQFRESQHLRRLGVQKRHHTTDRRLLINGNEEHVDLNISLNEIIGTRSLTHVVYSQCTK